MSKETSLKVSDPEADAETICLIQDFNTLLHKLEMYLKSNIKLVDQLAWLDYALIPQLPIYRDSEYQKKTDLLSNVMLLISAHCSFFNYELLKQVFEYLQYKDGKELMQIYEENFCSYVKQRCVYMLPSNLMVAQNDKTSCKVKVELDSSFRKCRQVYLKILQRDISKILKVEVVQLVVAGIEFSSIYIIFHLLKELLDSVFRLSNEQLQQIVQLQYENAKIYSLTCNEFFYDLKGK